MTESAVVPGSAVALGSAWGLPIVDFHCHFPVPDPEPDPARQAYRRAHGDRKADELDRRWRRAQEEWWDAYGFPYPEQVEPPAAVQAERWQQEIDAAGVERVVFLTGGGNDALAAAIAGHPRMLGFAHHDPFASGAAAELRRAVGELGLRGYKVIAPSLLGAIDDPALHPVWQAAEDLGVPVLIHFGVHDGGGGTGAHPNINPLRLHDVAKAFPDVSFVVPHFGCGYPGELLQLAWTCTNVLVDTSGNNEWVRWMPYPLSVANLFRRFLDTVGPQRVVFGSDSAHFPRGLVRRYYDDQVGIARDLGLSAADLRAVFAGNARRLLGLDESP